TPMKDRRALHALGNSQGCFLSLTLLILGTNTAFAATPAFKQERDNQAISGSTSKATFTAPVSSGNLIVLYLIWDHTGGASVSDSLGNTYVNAVGPTRWSNGRYSTQIFYSNSSSSGVDSVTATFATKLNRFGIIYAHEYSGIRGSSPIDVTAAG